MKVRARVAFVSFVAGMTTYEQGQEFDLPVGGETWVSVGLVEVVDELEALDDPTPTTAPRKRAARKAKGDDR